MVRVSEAMSDCSSRGEAELRILNFKTTWSEFQKASQTAAERGKAELRILDFKTTWSEFKKASQTAAEQGKAKLCILTLKPPGHSPFSLTFTYHENIYSNYKPYNNERRLLFKDSIEHQNIRYHRSYREPNYAPKKCTISEIRKEY